MLRGVPPVYIMSQVPFTVIFNLYVFIGKSLKKLALSSRVAPVRTESLEQSGVEWSGAERGGAA